MDEEVWKPIPGYAGYEASTLGRIYSKRSKIILSQYLSRGYATVHMPSGPYAVHRLVLLAFVGLCPDDMECSHLDGSRTNSRIDNLCYETHAENAKRIVDIGKGARKYSVETIAEIRTWRKRGYTCKYIADIFGSSRAYISDICNGHARTRNA